MLLLRYDASSSIINGTAQIPKDVTEDDEIITMLEGMKLWECFLFVCLFFVFCIGSHLPLFSNIAFCSRRKERDEAEGGEASGSSQRGGHLHID